MTGDRLPCGHPNGWMLRLRDNNNLHKYCWGCMVELLKPMGLTEVYTPVEPSTRTQTTAQLANSESVIVKTKK